MKKIIRLTESDLSHMIKRIIKEQEDTSMDEYINWDIRATECSEVSRTGRMSSMGVSYDEDGNPEVFIRYCKGDDEELDYLKRKARREIEMGNQLPSDLDENEDSFLSKRKNKKEMRDAARKWVNSKSKEERKEIEMNFKGHDGWVDAIGSAYDEQW